MPDADGSGERGEQTPQRHSGGGRRRHGKAMDVSGRRGKGIHYAGERMQTKEGKGK